MPPPPPPQGLQWWLGQQLETESNERAASMFQTDGLVEQTVPGVAGAPLLGVTAKVAGVTGVVGAWEEEEEEPSRGAPPEEGVAAADWLRELWRSSRGGEIFLGLLGCEVLLTKFCYLEEELLVAGPPLPSRLASPGPARAPRPSRNKLQWSRERQRLSKRLHSLSLK